jgi:hypothetical protein
MAALFSVTAPSRLRTSPAVKPSAPLRRPLPGLEGRFLNCTVTHTDPHLQSPTPAVVHPHDVVPQSLVEREGLALPAAFESNEVSEEAAMPTAQLVLIANEVDSRGFPRHGRKLGDQIVFTDDLRETTMLLSLGASTRVFAYLSASRILTGRVAAGKAATRVGRDGLSPRRCGRRFRSRRRRSSCRAGRRPGCRCRG